MRQDFREPKRRQTPWSCGHKGKIWYANVHADVYDVGVIENAKRLVDVAMPQKLNTFFGGHFYSFVTREYLLNLLLFYYKDHGKFPEGSVCVVDKWAWDGMAYQRGGVWCRNWIWRFMSRDDFTSPGYWISIPSLQSVLQKTAFP